MSLPSTSFENQDSIMQNIMGAHKNGYGMSNHVLFVNETSKLTASQIKLSQNTKKVTPGIQIKYILGDYISSIRSVIAQTNSHTQVPANENYVPSICSQDQKPVSDYFSSDFSKSSPLSIQSEDEDEEDSIVLEGSKKIKKIRQEKLSNSNADSSTKTKTLKFKKDFWTAEEDAQLLTLMDKHGKKWTLIGKKIGKRTGKQVRDRYLNNLRPDIKNKDWTEEEDMLFLSLLEKIGKKWCQIATLIPGRTESQVKNHFYAQIMKQIPEKVQEILNPKAILDDSSKESSLINVVQNEQKNQSCSVSYTQDVNYIDPQDFLCSWNNSIENQSKTNSELINSPSLDKSPFEELSFDLENYENLFDLSACEQFQSYDFDPKFLEATLRDL